MEYLQFLRDVINVSVGVGFESGQLGNRVSLLFDLQTFSSMSSCPGAASKSTILSSSLEVADTPYRFI